MQGNFSQPQRAQSAQRFKSIILLSYFLRSLRSLRLKNIGADGVLLVLDVVACQLIAGLSHTELVRRQLGGIHAVHQVVLIGNALLLLDVIPPQAAVQPFVARIVKHAEHSVLHPSLLRGTGQRLELRR